MARHTALVSAIGSILLASSDARAQLTASPKELNVGAYAGNQWLLTPLITIPFTQQQVHGASSFTSNTPATFTELRFLKTYDQNRFVTFDFELYVAQAPTDALGAQPTLAANVIASTEVNVFQRKLIQLNGYYGNPLRILFDSPFAWNGSHLSWRANQYSSKTSAQYFQIWATSLTTTGTSIAASCNGTASSFVETPGGNARLGARFSGGSGKTGVLMLGAQPSWTTLAPFAPTCLLLLSAIVGPSGVVDSEGELYFSLPIPSQPWLAGMALVHQVALLAPGSNPLGVQTSSVGRDIIQTRFDLASIINDTSAGATQGTLTLHRGAYVAFY